MAYDEALAARIRRALPPRDGITEKRMFGGLAFLRGEHMVVAVVRDALLARLGKEGAEAALAEPHVRPMAMGGRTMGGFVLVDSDGLHGAALGTWIDRCRAFVKTLPPKKVTGKPG